ncbi:MAG: phosphoglycerate dehydrogenase [Planctomycetes bacterium]|nr:phosphoglycerate dehydrogenase [Planctomycetota bacterium]
MSKVLCASLNAKRGPHVEILQNAGFEVEHPGTDIDLFVEENIGAQLSGCVATIAGSEPYTEKVLSMAPDLRVIARSGVGFDAVDLAACDKAGVVVTTTPGVNHHSVAEHTIALLMGVARGFPLSDHRVREDRWARTPAPRVMGTTLGIIGLGWIGRAVAFRAIGLGMKVIADEPYPAQEFLEQWPVELTDRDDLFARSDYVSLHCPASAENRHLINAESLAKMKKGAVLINTARGALVDEQALYDALKSGHLRGAGLDVFEQEPLPLSSPLLELENVLTSGHVAGLDIESQRDTFIMVAETIIQLRDGGWPTPCIRNMQGVSDWTWNRNSS